MKTMPAGVFKTKCLSVMDEVKAKREAVVITKHGQPVAKLVPVDTGVDEIFGFFSGRGSITGDVVSPALSPRRVGQSSMILVYTHIVVWLALEPANISKKARAAIEETRHSGQGLAISDITLLEIAQIESKSRIKLNSSLETFLSEVEVRFVVLPITGRVYTGHGASGRLPQRPGRSCHRSHRAGRGGSSGYRRRRYPPI
jgi:PIN domain nuclease of toxin-antitoxin system/antitoxin (DNA-binding transcriptional repressor) of toxin-antitoxin stability system